MRSTDLDPLMPIHQPRVTNLFVIDPRHFAVDQCGATIVAVVLSKESNRSVQAASKSVVRLKTLRDRKGLPGTTDTASSTSSIARSRVRKIVAFVVLLREPNGQLQLVLHAHPNHPSDVRAAITGASDYTDLLDAVRWELFRSGRPVVPSIDAHMQPHSHPGCLSTLWLEPLALSDRVQLGPTVVQRRAGRSPRANERSDPIGWPAPNPRFTRHRRMPAAFV